MCTERHGRGMEGQTWYHEQNSFTANEAFSAAHMKCEKLWSFSRLFLEIWVMLVDNYIVVGDLALVTSAILVQVQPFSIMCAYQSGLHIFIIFLLSPMTLFEAVLDLEFEPFAVIPSSTSIYHNLNKINMTLAYSHKINPCIFSWLRNQPCNFFLSCLFFFVLFFFNKCG